MPCHHNFWGPSRTLTGLWYGQNTKYLGSHSSFGMFCGSNISNNFGFSAESLADNAERVKSKNDLRRKRAEEVEDWRVLLPYRQFDRYSSILAFQFDKLLFLFWIFQFGGLLFTRADFRYTSILVKYFYSFFGSPELIFRFDRHTSIPVLDYQRISLNQQPVAKRF